MSRYRLEAQEPGLARVVINDDQVIGVVARGALIELKDGRVVVRGRRWFVVGYEYCSFRTVADAADALFTHHRNLGDASVEIAEIKHLESFLPLARRASRRAERKDIAKRINRETKRSLRELRRDYHESLRRASVAHGGLSVGEAGGV